MKSIFIILLLCSASLAEANRLLEVEDYYSAKTAEFLRSRYPRKAYTVYVKVDADEKPDLRSPSSINSSPSLNLPYFDQISERDISFWDRKDLSLASLISYLKSIYVKVDIEGTFSNEELEQMKNGLMAYLKLSETYDRIELNPKSWQTHSFWDSHNGLLAIGFSLFSLLTGVFIFIFRSGIKSLIKGLSQPLSEIGKSAENVANSSGLVGSMPSLQNQKFNQQNLQGQNLLNIEKSKKVAEDIQKLSSFLIQPNAELLHKLETLGEKDPHTLGSLFSEMKVEDLEKLVQWSRGSWWRTAITQPGALTNESVEMLKEINQIYVRTQLSGDSQVSEEDQDLAKTLARLSNKQFGPLLEGLSFEKAEPILRLLPNQTMIEVSKYLYPGRWAEIFKNPTKKVSLDKSIRNQTKEKALKVCPLKTKKEIADYFKDSDLIDFLDKSSTKDERELYRMLPQDSWIKTDRIPFYDIFSQSEDILKKLATDLPLEVWAFALTACDRDECEDLYKYFTSRQKFILREYKNKMQFQSPSTADVVRAKKQITTSLLRIQQINHGTTDVDKTA